MHRDSDFSYPPVETSSADVGCIYIGTLAGARSLHKILHIARMRLQERLNAGIARKDYPTVLACLKALDAASEVVVARLALAGSDAGHATDFPFPTPLSPHFSTFKGDTSCPEKAFLP